MAVKYTVLLTHETEQDAFAAEVPILDVVTYGATKQEALAAAREAIELDLVGRAQHDEEIPIEPDDYLALREVVLEAVSLEGVSGISGQEEEIGRKLAKLTGKSGAASVIGPNLPDWEPISITRVATSPWGLGAATRFPAGAPGDWRHWREVVEGIATPVPDEYRAVVDAIVAQDQGIADTIASASQTVASLRDDLAVQIERAGLAFRATPEQQADYLILSYLLSQVLRIGIDRADHDREVEAEGRQSVSHTR